MAIIRITKDGRSADMMCDSLAAARIAYPLHECLDITPKEELAREWRNSELLRTDVLVVLPDYPKKTETIAYRVKLRDWPSTSDFPAKKPTLEVE